MHPSVIAFSAQNDGFVVLFCFVKSFHDACACDAITPLWHSPPSFVGIRVMRPVSRRRWASGLFPEMLSAMVLSSLRQHFAPGWCSWGRGAVHRTLQCAHRLSGVPSPLPRLQGPSLPQPLR